MWSRIWGWRQQGPGPSGKPRSVGLDNLPPNVADLIAQRLPTQNAVRLAATSREQRRRAKSNKTLRGKLTPFAGLPANGPERAARALEQYLLFTGHVASLRASGGHPLETRDELRMMPDTHAVASWRRHFGRNWNRDLNYFENHNYEGPEKFHVDLSVRQTGKQSPLEVPLYAVLRKRSLSAIGRIGAPSAPGWPQKDTERLLRIVDAAIENLQLSPTWNADINARPLFRFENTNAGQRTVVPATWDYKGRAMGGGALANHIAKSIGQQVLSGERLRRYAVGGAFETLSIRLQFRHQPNNRNRKKMFIGVSVELAKGPSVTTDRASFSIDPYIKPDGTLQWHMGTQGSDDFPASLRPTMRNVARLLTRQRIKADSIRHEGRAIEVLQARTGSSKIEDAELNHRAENRGLVNRARAHREQDNRARAERVRANRAQANRAQANRAQANRAQGNTSRTAQRNATPSSFSGSIYDLLRTQPNTRSMGQKIHAAKRHRSVAKFPNTRRHGYHSNHSNRD